MTANVLQTTSPVRSYYGKDPHWLLPFFKVQRLHTNDRRSAPMARSTSEKEINDRALDDLVAYLKALR